MYTVYTLNNQCGTLNYTLGVTKQTRLRIWGNDTGDFERSETEERDAQPFTGHSLHKGKGTIRLETVVVYCCLGLYWCVLAIWSFTKMCCWEIKTKLTHTHTLRCIYNICESTIYQSTPSDLTRSLHFLLFSIYLHGPLKPRSQLAENALSCFFCSGCNCKNTNVSLDFSNLVLASHQDFQKWHTKHASTLEILMSV